MAQHSMTTWEGRPVERSGGRAGARPGRSNRTSRGCRSAGARRLWGATQHACPPGASALRRYAAGRRLHACSRCAAQSGPTTGWLAPTRQPRCEPLPTSRAVSGSTFCPAKPLAAAHRSFTAGRRRGSSSATSAGCPTAPPHGLCCAVQPQACRLSSPRLAAPPSVCRVCSCPSAPSASHTCAP